MQNPCIFMSSWARPRRSCWGRYWQDDSERRDERQGDRVVPPAGQQGRKRTAEVIWIVQQVSHLQALLLAQLHEDLRDRNYPKKWVGLLPAFPPSLQRFPQRIHTQSCSRPPALRRAQQPDVCDPFFTQICTSLIRADDLYGVHRDHPKSLPARVRLRFPVIVPSAQTVRHQKHQRIQQAAFFSDGTSFAIPHATQRTFTRAISQGNLHNWGEYLRLYPRFHHKSSWQVAHIPLTHERNRGFFRICIISWGEPWNVRKFLVLGHLKPQVAFSQRAHRVAPQRQEKGQQEVSVVISISHVFTLTLSLTYNIMD